MAVIMPLGAPPCQGLPSLASCKTRAAMASSLLRLSRAQKTATFENYGQGHDRTGQKRPHQRSASLEIFPT